MPSAPHLRFCASARAEGAGLKKWIGKADRSVMAENPFEKGVSSSRAGSDTFWKWIGGGVVLIVVFFVCYDQVIRARERKLYRMHQDMMRDAMNQVRSLR